MYFMSRVAPDDTDMRLKQVFLWSWETFSRSVRYKRIEPAHPCMFKICRHVYQFFNSLLTEIFNR